MTCSSAKMAASWQQLAYGTTSTSAVFNRGQ